MDLKYCLAVTAAEFGALEALPSQLAWMACHFSPAGKGLSNLPMALPPGSVIMIDDSLPPEGHDPALIAAQLQQLVQDQQASGIVLDLQRPESEESARIARVLTEELSCPVCVSPFYAKDLRGPVLLPPPPLHQSVEKHIAPWKGREIWLEAALEAERITVTEEGSFATPIPFSPLPEDYFTDDALCCRYQAKVLEDRAIFTLVRDKEMLNKLLRKAAEQGIQQALGLYQQLGQRL